jgi:uncharacterized protein YaiL (DUF2058 family)
MGSSLREQLLKAGLADKSRVQQAKKQARQNQRAAAGTGTDSVARAVARAQAEKESRDRELNRQKEIKQAARARRALQREYAERNKLNDPKAQDAYNFVHGSNVKRLYVTARQRDQLGRAELSIAQVDGRYYLVMAEVGRRLADMVAGTFVYTPAPETTPTEDDPYAAYQVPDDLMW